MENMKLAEFFDLSFPYMGIMDFIDEGVYEHFDVKLEGGYRH